MRYALAAFLALAASVAMTPAPAQADPYHWCANYAGGRGGASNCYFVTLAQCRAAISGNGGFCDPNTFYDGRPVITPGDTVTRSRRR